MSSLSLSWPSDKDCNEDETFPMSLHEGLKDDYHLAFSSDSMESLPDLYSASDESRVESRVEQKPAGVVVDRERFGWKTPTRRKKSPKKQKSLIKNSSDSPESKSSYATATSELSTARDQEAVWRRKVEQLESKLVSQQEESHLLTSLRQMRQKAESNDGGHSPEEQLVGRYPNESKNDDLERTQQLATKNEVEQHELLRENKTLKEEKKKLATDLKERDETIAMLRDALERKEREFQAETELKMSALVKENEALKREKKHADKDLEHCLAEKDEAIEELRRKLNDERQQNESRDEMERRILSLTQENEALQQQNEQTTQDAAILVAEKEETISMLQQDVQALELQLRQRHKSHTETDHAMLAVLQENETLQQENDALRQQSEQAQHDLETCATVKDETIETLHKDMEALELELSQEGKTRQEMEDKILSLSQENERLQQEKEQAKQKRATCAAAKDETIATLRQDLTKLELQLEAERQNAESSTKTDDDGLVLMSGDLHARIEDCETELQEMGVAISNENDAMEPMGDSFVQTPSKDEAFALTVASTHEQEPLSSPMMQQSVGLAQSLICLLTDDRAIQEEGQVLDQLASLSTMLDRADIQEGPLSTPSTVPFSMYQRMEQRCHLLESERAQLIDETLSMMESARSANAVQLDLAISEFKERAQVQVMECVDAVLEQREDCAEAVNEAIELLNASLVLKDDESRSVSVNESDGSE